jgi:hypothetical protein
MNNIILHLRYSKGISAFLRFLGWLKENFDFVDISTIQQMNFYNNKNINFILIPYAFRIMDNITEKCKFIENHPEAKIIRFFNEYNLSENGSLAKIFKKRPIDYLITNYEREIINNKNYKQRIVINVNCLTMFDFKRDFTEDKRIESPLYWGTFRRGRIDYFKKYLVDKDIFLSTSVKNIKKFKQIGANVTFLKQIKNIGSELCPLKNFYFTFYIEDKITHTNYNFPANRFYEALSYDIVMFYDVNCKNTFEKYGVEIDNEFWVDGVKDLKEKAQTKFYKDFLLKQKRLKEYAIEERKKFEENTKKIFEEILFSNRESN